MFTILHVLLRRTNVIVLSLAVAIGGCSTMSVSEMERKYEADAPSDRTELTTNIQKMLKDKGFYAGPIDGIAGPGTLSALTTYQKKNGLPSTGGINAKAYGQLSIWDVSRELERRTREQQDEQSGRLTAKASSTVKGNSSSKGTSKNSSSGSVDEQEATKRKELSRNHPSVNFQVSCPNLYIPKVYEKKYQNLIPVYAIAVLNNSTKRYSVEYDLVYVEGTKAVATKRVFGTTLPGRQGYAKTLTETKSFTARPDTFTEVLLIEKNQRAGSQITKIEAVDIFKCTSP